MAAKQATVNLLSGGNPQIAKGDGDAPVQAYIAAMPGWKSDVGRRLDALVVRHVPNVRKAVKWNSPFYGVEGRGWFLSFHVFTRFVKVTFFNGASLKPAPPGGQQPEARWIDVHEDDLDAAQMGDWIRQATTLPGWNGSSARIEAGAAPVVTQRDKAGSMKKTDSNGSTSASEPGSAAALIDAKIAALADWRGPMLARLRAAVLAADAGVVEEWKWDTPVWSCDGIIATGEVYKSVVKMTFAKGASLPDPARLFNSSLEGNVRRAIDFREGEKVDLKALKDLVRAAATLNRAKSAAKKAPAEKAAAKTVAKKAAAKKAPARKAAAKPKK